MGGLFGSKSKTTKKEPEPPKTVKVQHTDPMQDQATQMAVKQKAAAASREKSRPSLLDPDATGYGLGG